MEDNKQYYGGPHVRSTVRLLSASSFREFVERYFNVPVVKKMTRREFDRYDDDTKKKVKDGPYVSAAVFNDEGVDRKDENVGAITLALLDFDSITDRDREEGFVDYSNQLYDGIDALKNALYPYNFVCYETISSRHNDRRIRVVVDLETMEPHLHRPVIRFIASLLGVELNRWKGRIESMTTSLPMFRPVQFQGEEYTAVLASRVDGQELEELDLPRSCMSEENGEPGERTYAYQGGVESLGLMHLPVIGITVDDVESILTHIDPDESYHLWVSVGMALRHQFRNDEEEARQAYEIFDTWSSGGAKYSDSDETYAKWNSFTPDATGKAPITIRSVFECAKLGGWDPAVLSKKIKVNLSDWIETCTDADELMSEGANRIAALPFKNEIVEESLVVKIRVRIKELTNTQVDKATIKKAVRAVRRQSTNDDEDGDLPSWMRPWIFITTRNVFRHMGNGIELSPEAFNNTFSRDLMNLGGDGESALTGKPSIMPVNFALNVKDMKRVDGTTYDPRHGAEEPFFEHEGRLYLNEYRASTVPQLDELNSTKAGKIFLHHIKILTGDDEIAMVLMDFFAHTIQKPGILVPWIPLIQSGEGAGKTIVGRAIGHAIGMPNYKLVGPKPMLSDFNDWAFFCQFLVLEEIKVPGHSRADVMNTFKDIAANELVSLNQKFQDVRLVQNVANKLAFTNFHDALHMEDSDRRWMPIKSPIQTEEQALALSESGHFKRFTKLYKYGGALRQFFLDWKISDSFPAHGPAPKTAFRREMIDESKNPLQVAIEETIRDEEVSLVQSDLIFGPALSGRLEAAITNNNKKVSYFLRRLGYVPYENGTKFRLNGPRGIIWVHSSRFDDDLGLPVDILKGRVEENEEKDL